MTADLANDHGEDVFRDTATQRGDSAKEVRAGDERTADRSAPDGDAAESSTVDGGDAGRNTGDGTASERITGDGGDAEGGSSGGSAGDGSAGAAAAQGLDRKTDETLAGLADVAPIEVNAGGIVPAEDLIGRDAQKEALLRLAAPPAHGAVLLGDRRIGKTSLLRTVEQPLREAGHLVVRVSAETADLETFGADLLKGLQKGLRESGGKWPWDVQLEGEAAVSVGIAKFALRGKAQRGTKDVEEDLFVACARAARDLGPGHRVVFLLDEITVLAAELARKSPDDAREFLRTLRKARQELPEVTMFMAGSIGLHHALPDQTLVNDLTAIHVDVLEREDALTLAAGLIKGAFLQVTDISAVAAEMVEQTSGFPFYLHGIADMLSQLEGPVTPRDVKEVFQEALEQGRWAIRDYDDRLDPYYGPDVELVRAILDSFASAEDPLDIEALEEATAVAAHQPSRTHLLGLLDRLEADHYLRRIGNSSTMANGLIRRIWRHIRRI